MPPPAIAIDISQLASDGSNGGAARFVLPLLSALGASKEFRLRLLVRPGAVTTAIEAVPSADEIIELGAPGRPREPSRLERLSRRLPVALSTLLPDPFPLRRRGVAALLSPLQSAVFEERGLPHVAVAYDFQDLYFPGNFPREERRRRRVFRSALRRCAGVIAISEATRVDAVAAAGVLPERVRVVYPSGPLERKPLPPEEIRTRLGAVGLEADRFCLYPANDWPHKNLDALLTALAREGTPPVRSDPTIALCGMTPGSRDRLAARLRESRLEERVRLLGIVPDADLTALVQGARFLFFPSLFEGFGLPILEALRLGTPVACSDLPALREVAGDAAFYFSPSAPGSITAALGRMAADGPLRDALRARGLVRATLFPPGEAVEGFAKELRRVLR